MKIGNLIVALVCAAAFAACALGKDSYILGLADVNDDETQKIAEGVLERLVTTAPSGARIQVFNATTQRRLADFEVPPTSNPTGRKNRVFKDVEPVLQHLRQSRSVRAGQGSALDIPEFLNVVGSSIRDAGASTQVILLGSPFHTVSESEAMNFRPGFYPSDSHIRAGRQSTFGTADRRGLLDGVFVHFALVGQIGTPRERAPVQRFWALWVREQGGTLSSFLPTVDLVTDRALRGVNDAVRSDELDLKDERLLMLPVEAVPAPVAIPMPAPVPAPAAPEPVSLTKTVGHDVDLVIVIDGTSSMKPVLAQIGTIVKNLARLGAKLTPRFTIGLVVYRDAKNTSRLDPVEVRRLAGVADQYAGIELVDNFVDKPQISTRVVTESEGERAKSVSDKTEMMSHMTGLLAHADIESALTTGVGMLTKGSAKRKVLILVGDVGTSETDRERGVSAADRASAERAAETVGNLVAAGGGVRIITLYTGGPYAADAEDTIAFFKRVAALAEPYGVYTTDLKTIDEKLTRAMLAP